MQRLLAELVFAVSGQVGLELGLDCLQKLLTAVSGLSPAAGVAQCLRLGLGLASWCCPLLGLGHQAGMVSPAGLAEAPLQCLLLAGRCSLLTSPACLPGLAEAPLQCLLLVLEVECLLAGQCLLLTLGWCHQAAMTPACLPGLAESPLQCLLLALELGCLLGGQCLLLTLHEAGMSPAGLPGLAEALLLALELGCLLALGLGHEAGMSCAGLPGLAEALLLALELGCLLAGQCLPLGLGHEAGMSPVCLAGLGEAPLQCLLLALEVGCLLAGQCLLLMLELGRKAGVTGSGLAETPLQCLLLAAGLGQQMSPAGRQALALELGLSAVQGRLEVMSPVGKLGLGVGEAGFLVMGCSTQPPGSHVSSQLETVPSTRSSHGLASQLESPHLLWVLLLFAPGALKGLQGELNGGGNWQAAPALSVQMPALPSAPP